jgi:hypothetical protein
VPGFHPSSWIQSKCSPWFARCPACRLRPSPSSISLSGHCCRCFDQFPLVHKEGDVPRRHRHVGSKLMPLFISFDWTCRRHRHLPTLHCSFVRCPGIHAVCLSRRYASCGLCTVTKFLKRLDRGTRIMERETLLKKGFSTVETKLIYVPGDYGPVANNWWYMCGAVSSFT